MSDAQNLNDFFAQQSKKNKKTKKGAANKSKAAARKDSDEEIKEATSAAAATQPEASKQQPAQDFADSSDDESNTIVLNEGSKKIVDRKDLEAGQKKKESEAEGLAAWGLGSKLGQAPETESQPSKAPLRGVDRSAAGGAGQINFGKPTFTRKQKGVMDTQDFPDLDDSTKAGKGGNNTSKADGAMMFMSGAPARGARVEGEARQDEEAKAPVQATKPVFRGKAKFNTGGATNDEVQNSRMNYDFSKMRMSAATTKTKDGEKVEGEQGEQRERRQPGAPKRMMDFQQDDDFEVVAEKPKRQPGHNRAAGEGVDNMDFGRGKPSFTRGGQ